MTDPQDKRRSFRRAPPDQRRVELMEATLRVIASHGIESASVRRIAAEADVTPGLIRHYFDAKEDLICAAYAHHMQVLLTASAEAQDAGHDSAIARLAGLVTRTLSPPVTGTQALQLWAAFIQMIGHDKKMRQVHFDSYGDFRRILEAAIADAFTETGRKSAPGEIRRLALACNAVLDGLWIEGSALPDLLPAADLVAIGLHSVGAILRLPLLQKDSQIS